MLLKTLKYPLENTRLYLIANTSKFHDLVHILVLKAGLVQSLLQDKSILNEPKLLYRFR